MPFQCQYLKYITKLMLGEDGQARGRRNILPSTQRTHSPDLTECRNISCTSIFSKIFEGEVLLKLCAKLTPDPHKYGGAPKCGTEHMLVELWEKILTALEGGKGAKILLGVDYKTAFNRMDHGVCLRRLSELGASEGSLVLVKAFLEERSMSNEIDGHSLAPVKIKRGSPQGSVYIFGNVFLHTILCI